MNTIILLFIGVLFFAAFTAYPASAASIDRVDGVNCPSASVFSPESDILYIGASCDGMVYALRAGAGPVTIKNTLSIGAEPTAMDISPDGRTLYVISRDTGTMTVIDTAEMRILNTLFVGESPYKIMAGPSGNRLFILNESDGDLVSVSAGTMNIAGKLHLGAELSDMAVSNDGGVVYAIDKQFHPMPDDRLLVIDAATMKIKETICVEDYINRLDLSPDGKRLVASSGMMHIFNTADMKEMLEPSLIKYGSYGCDIVFTNDGGTMYVVGTVASSMFGNYSRVNVISLADARIAYTGGSYAFGAGQIGISPENSVLYFLTSYSVNVWDAGVFMWPQTLPELPLEEIKFVKDDKTAKTGLKVSQVVSGRLFAYGEDGLYVVAVPPYYRINGPLELTGNEEWPFTALPLISPVESPGFFTDDPRVLSVDRESGNVMDAVEGDTALYVKEKSTGAILNKRNIRVFDKSFLARGCETWDAADMSGHSYGKIFVDSELDMIFTGNQFNELMALNAKSLQADNLMESIPAEWGRIYRVLYDESSKKIFVLCTHSIYVIDGRTGLMIRDIPLEGLTVGEEYNSSFFFTPDKSRIVLLVDKPTADGYIPYLAAVNPETYAVSTMPDIKGELYGICAGFSGDAFFVLDETGLYKISAQTHETLSHASVDFSGVKYPPLNFVTMTPVSDNRVFSVYGNSVLLVDADKGVAARISVDDADMAGGGAGVSPDEPKVYIGLLNCVHGVPASGLAVIDTAAFRVIRPTMDGMQASDMLIDDKRGVVYAVFPDSGSEYHPSQLVTFNAESMEIMNTRVISEGSGLAMDREGKRLFISGGDHVEIMALDSDAQPPRAPDIYVSGPRNHLSMWKRSHLNGWIESDLSTVSGNSAVNGAPFHIETGNADYVFAQSAENALLMWKRVVGGTWTMKNLSAETGVFISGAPNAASYIDTYGNELIHVVTVAENGHLLEWWRVNEDDFHITDLTNDAGGPLVAGRPAYMYENGVQHVMAVSTDGQLLEYWWVEGLGWHLENITGVTGGNDRVAGNPAYAYANGLQAVYVRTADNRLLGFWWTADTGWRMEDLSRLMGGVAFSGNPVAADARHFFIRSADNRLIEYWWATDSGWHFEDISAHCGGIAITGDPQYEWIEGVQYVYADTGGYTPSIFSWTVETGWGVQKMKAFHPYRIY